MLRISCEPVLEFAIFAGVLPSWVLYSPILIGLVTIFPVGSATRPEPHRVGAAPKTSALIDKPLILNPIKSGPEFA
ncbi:hypothetical protein CKO42_15270 [Lamprobacter modestohalophilus]|uniref:Uncharacterized protein n=2 Tax=Lamprobacter modestohalophilus TaxID=1064514 RepID=A0A9X0WA22_9GAMM|nr:hypothetical protein [Lamprobacter modestohalophilus]